jgi:hypothetical protein
VKPDELPAGWGLLYCHPGKVEVVVEHNLKVFEPQITANEAPILYSLVRRAILRGFDVACKYSEKP